MLAREEENARLILNIVSAGTISLTVFSFSMVMIVLSQASSNLTPRVIPRLATVKAHQVVLGFYIGTILYSMILLLNFQKEEEGKVSTPAIAVLVSLVCGLLCIILFVYFIHSISKTIQVDNILNHVFTRAYEALELEKVESKKFKRKSHGLQTDDCYLVRSTRSGYLKLIELEELLDITVKHDLQLTIMADVGAFVVEGIPILKLNGRAEPDKQLSNELEDCFSLSLKEVIMEDFEQGVKQISEIAVKALSPGINDPGTAIKAIDFLTLLFLRRLRSQPNECLFDSEDTPRVTEKIISLDELLFRYLSPIRTYGKGDLQINLRLLHCMEGLILAETKSVETLENFVQHTKAIVYDADELIMNKIDRAKLNESIKKLNTHLPSELNIASLEI